MAGGAGNGPAGTGGVGMSNFAGAIRLDLANHGTSERADSLTLSNCPHESLARDDVVNGRHHRLLEANAEFGEDRHQSRSKGVKVLL